MSVAIVTKYLPPTDYHGSRIVATVPERLASSRRHWHDTDCPDGEHRELYRPGHWRLTVPYRYDLSGEDVHRVAAEALRDRLGWTGRLIGGATDDGYAFVFAGQE